MVRKETKIRVHDVKVVRGAEIESDYHLVLMKLSMRSKGERKDMVKNRARVKIERLKERGEQLKYQCRIRQKMNSGSRHEGQAEGATVEEACVEFKEAILNTAVEVWGETVKGPAEEDKMVE